MSAIDPAGYCHCPADLARDPGNGAEAADGFLVLLAEQEARTCACYVLPVGPADPADLGGKPGIWFQRVLGAS
jgi:hypothetical protein